MEVEANRPQLPALLNEIGVIKEPDAIAESERLLLDILDRNLLQIPSFCNRVLWLRDSRLDMSNNNSSHLLSFWTYALDTMDHTFGDYYIPSSEIPIQDLSRNVEVFDLFYQFAATNEQFRTYFLETPEWDLNRSDHNLDGNNGPVVRAVQSLLGEPENIGNVSEKANIFYRSEVAVGRLYDQLKHGESVEETPEVAFPEPEPRVIRLATRLRDRHGRETLSEEEIQALADDVPYTVIYEDEVDQESELPPAPSSTITPEQQRALEKQEKVEEAIREVQAIVGNNRAIDEDSRNYRDNWDRRLTDLGDLLHHLDRILINEIGSTRDDVIADSASYLRNRINEILDLQFGEIGYILEYEIKNFQYINDTLSQNVISIIQRIAEIEFKTQERDNLLDTLPKISQAITETVNGNEEFRDRILAIVKDQLGDLSSNLTDDQIERLINQYNSSLQPLRESVELVTQRMLRDQEHRMTDNSNHFRNIERLVDEIIALGDTESRRTVKMVGSRPAPSMNLQQRKIRNEEFEDENLSRPEVVEVADRIADFLYSYPEGTISELTLATHFNLTPEIAREVFLLLEKTDFLGSTITVGEPFASAGLRRIIR